MYWLGRNFYAFTTFWFNPKVIQKIRLEKAMGILDVPKREYIEWFAEFGKFLFSRPVFILISMIYSFQYTSKTRIDAQTGKALEPVVL